MMVLVKFIGLLMFDDGGNQNQQGGPVPLMWCAWCAALCSGLVVFSCSLVQL